MKNIIFYTRLVKIIACILMPTVIVNLLIKWFFPEIFFSSYTLGNFFQDYQPSDHIITTMPLLHRLIGMLVDSISSGSLLIILWLITSIMNQFQKSETFSFSVVTLFTTISKLAFSLAIYTPINRSLLSVITSWHNGPGQRILTVSFGSADLFNILIFGFLMVMTLLMQYGTTLQNEHNLTV